ncbi:MAG: mechanosensitive ion channel family protein [Pseudomonadota bacterium]
MHSLLRCRALFFAGLAFAVSLLCSAGPALAQATPEQPARDIAVGESAASDADIRRAIERLLDEIEGFDDVDVSVASGVVTLRGQVLDGQARERLLSIVTRVDGVAAIDAEAVEQTGALTDRLAPALSRLADRGRDLLLNAPIFAVAVAAFALIALTGRSLTRQLAFWRRLAPNAFIAEIYRALARIGFVVLGLVVALEILNATALLGAVLGAAGVVGLALGFAVRDTVENFIASILLSLRQPFRPNDFVEIDGDMGSVARLTSRATILISPDGNQIRIPNATVFKGRIVNFTRHAQRRFTFQLGVEAESDLGAALGVGAGALEKLTFVLPDPPVAAWIEEVGDSNVLLTFAAWVNQRETDFLKARGEAIRVTKTALETQGFGLPEPIYRLRLDDAPFALREIDVPAEPRPSPSAPRPARAADTPAPAAADPDRVERAAEETADRERSAPDGGADLLSSDGVAE